MKVERTGRLWKPDKVSAYLGVSITCATALMTNGEIFSVQMQNEKILRTTKKSVDDYLKNIGLL